MKERIEVYESLRNEIMLIEEMQRNVWIYMYVLFGTLFAIGLEWSNYLLLATYIILLSFQCVINNFSYTICKLSIYIKVFFEETDRDISWETFHSYSMFKEHGKRKRKSITNFIGRIGVTFLGGLASVSFIYKLCSAHLENGAKLEWFDGLWIVLSIVLWIILYMLYKDYNNNNELELQLIIRKFKEEREQQKI